MNASRTACCVGFLAIAIAAFAAAAGTLPEEDSRARLGRSLFFGYSDRPIAASFGDAESVLTLKELNCAGCHGADGAGATEAGLTTPDIRARALRAKLNTKDPAALDGALVRALTQHRSASDQPLSLRMPRFSFQPNEVVALVSYLRSLGEAEPSSAGIDAERVRVAAVLPRDAMVSIHITRALQTRFERINLAGGIYGRKFELTVLDDVRTFVPNRYFAIIAPVVSKDDRGTICMLAERGTPVVGALMPEPCTGSPAGMIRTVASIAEQAAALMQETKRMADAKIVVTGSVWNLLPSDLQEAYADKSVKISDEALSLSNWLQTTTAKNIVVLVSTAQWRAVASQSNRNQLQSVATPYAAVAPVLGELGETWWHKLVMSVPEPFPARDDLATMAQELGEIPRMPAAQWLARSAADHLTSAMTQLGANTSRERVIAYFAHSRQNGIQVRADSAANVAWVHVARNGNVEPLARQEFINMISEH